MIILVTKTDYGFKATCPQGKEVTANKAKVINKFIQSQQSKLSRNGIS